MNFCSNCGGRVELKIPAGDDRPRYVCGACGMVHYRNPRVVAGAIVAAPEGILLCRRAIEPQYGRWTIPAGYLENGETVEACARRETREEAGAALVEVLPYALLNLSAINQLYFVYRSRLQGSFQAGEESLEARLFRPQEIPWDELSFAVVRRVLETYCRDLEEGRFRFRELDVEIQGHWQCADSG